MNHKDKNQYFKREIIMFNNIINKLEVLYKDCLKKDKKYTLNEEEKDLKSLDKKDQI